MLQTNKKRIIQDVASLPAIGNSKYIYHNTADGFFYYWNDVTNSYVELKNLNVLTTVQATPSATGNTTNLNSVFKDASGDTWIVDSNGDAVKAGSSSLFSLAIYSDNIANVTESGTDGQFLYITNTGDEFGVIDEVYVWIGGMWSPYPIAPSAEWNTTTSDPALTGNTGTLPRFVENTANSTKWYIDSTGVAKLIESSKVFAQVVYVNDLPASATVFSLENPPVTNDNSLKNLTNALYVVVSSDPAKNSQTWTSNGTTYSTYIVVAGTPFNIANTSIDAGSDKTSSIYRKGKVLIATNSSTQTTPLKDLHLQNGGASLLTSAFGSGQIFSTNDSSGPRFFLEHLTAAVNQKTSVIYTQNGITYLGAVVSDNGSTWIFANPLIINHSTGFVGIRTTTPLSNFEINGSFGANIRSITATTYTMLSDDYTVVMRTAAAVVTLGASVNRRVYNIKNASTGNITFTGHIDNVASATLTIPSGQSRMLQGDGTTWWII